MVITCQIGEMLLIEEAKWFSKKIQKLDSESFPMLDVGSSTERFRKKAQPWIEEYIFRPLSKKNYKVIHLDIKKGGGVDIVGDLGDKKLLEKLLKMKFQSIFCSNFLEHIRNKEEACQILTELIPSGGFLLVSGPFLYPFHPDPIDTKFRPTIHELAKLFPETQIISGEIIKCETFLQFITFNPIVFAQTVSRFLLPFYQPRGWIIGINHLRWIFRNFYATCLVLQKK